MNAGATDMNTDAGGIPRRPLGRTGESVSMLGLGGAHIARIPDADAIELVREAVDTGVTFMDNAWEYHDGRAEELMGRALRDGYRERVFLMTKHHGRDRNTAERHLEDSLRRLQTDVIDLWQFHEVIYPDDPDMIFGPDGAIEAAEAARKAGKVRFIGFTGHKDPAVLRRMLEMDFEWDTVQMPLSVLDHHFRSFEAEVLPTLLERAIGVLAMKTLASGHIVDDGIASVRDALSYVWSLPVSCLISGMTSLEMLRENAEVARTWRPPPESALEELLAGTREASANGRLERYKSSTDFDGRVGRRLHD